MGLLEPKFKTCSTMSPGSKEIFALGIEVVTLLRMASLKSSMAMPELF